MSTRSGKRIHGSIHENIVKPEEVIVGKNERKTRSRRLKENNCEEVVVAKSKKRHNYVSYPVDDEHNVQQNEVLVAKASKTALKEQDLNVSVITVDEIDSGKIVRQTRRTQKVSENVPEDIPVIDVEIVKTKKKNKKKKVSLEIDIQENNVVEAIPKKSKKRKNKLAKAVSEVPVVATENINVNKSTESIESFHSAAGSPVNSIMEKKIVKPNGSFSKYPRRASKRIKADSDEDKDEVPSENKNLNKNKKIKMSNDKCKFDSNHRSINLDNEAIDVKDATFKKDEVNVNLNTTFEKDTNRKRKSSVKNSTFEKNDFKLNTTFEKLNNSIKLDKTLEEDNEGRRKSLRSTCEKSAAPTIRGDNHNSTYESNTSKDISKKSLRSTFDKINTPNKDVKILNSTFEKTSTPSKNESTSMVVEQMKCLQSTFDKTETPSKKAKELNSTFETKVDNSVDNNKNRRRSQRISVSADRQAALNVTFENSNGTLNDSVNKPGSSKPNSTLDKSNDSQPTSMNTTFDKSKDSQQSTLNSTFDKESKLNSTYEKQPNQSDAKSSLISSVSASNLTFDKSDEISRISITSDDSRTENIVNTTPLLIESSMDESQLQESSPKDVSNSSDDAKLKPSATPLKREGTFTKDGPDVVSMSPKDRTSINKTPVKRMSLPSPGSTPFPFSKSSQREKSVLNVTRSLEKAARRSSLAEAAPRATRVMFCSPVNNPIVVMQQKRKVIKSNLKGSNKSFIFDESVSESVRPAPRKRSYTQNDAEDARAKRKRLADDQLQSVARLSRPRTSSATVKLSEPSTPSKKLSTPKKTPNAKSDAKVSRTKLPNFAALHQKQFAKMESLDECQVRKAKRAKQLLTPNGALAIIEKSSPKGRVTSTEPTKSVKEVAKKADAETKKPDAEVTKKSVTEVPTKPDTPSKAQKFTLDALRPGYTRFGFKMNLDFNPFSIPPKPKAPEAKPRENKPNGLVTRQPSQPSLAGATSGRREVAKQIVMRERSFTSLSDKRNQKRTTIKGVRTNRRFELQMKLRNINA